MLRSLFETSDDATLTWMRVLLGVVFWPHGAQKLLGWFGGGGLHGTLAAFTRMGIPAFFVSLVIMTEFFGALALILGLLTRLAALATAVNMFMAVLLLNGHFGMFMNWSGRQKGEGIEFHLLVFALAIPLIIKGAGAFSVDRLIAGHRTAEPVPARG